MANVEICDFIEFCRFGSVVISSLAMEMVTKLELFIFAGDNFVNKNKMWFSYFYGYVET